MLPVIMNELKPPKESKEPTIYKHDNIRLILFTSKHLKDKKQCAVELTYRMGCHSESHELWYYLSSRQVKKQVFPQYP